jgi:hypothetical protein
VPPFLNFVHFVGSVAPSHSSALHLSLAPSSQAARVPRGAPLTAEQVPLLAGMSQASHCASQRRLQHTPSVQKPDAHSPSAPHVLPSSFAQAPFVAPALHDAPSPHVATPQHTPSVQNMPVGHIELEVHAEPSPTFGRHLSPLQ